MVRWGLVRRYVSTCLAWSTGFVLLGCDRTPPQKQASSTAAPSAPAPAPSLVPNKAQPIPGQEATPEALLDLDRIDCDLPAPPKVQRQDARSEPLCFPKDLIFGICRAATLVVDHSSKWGWVTRVESRRNGGGWYREWSSDYLMGRGAVDECGTVAYQGSRYPGFSDQVRALLGAPSAVVRATLLDHRQRSATCDAARGAVAFGESSPGISHETGMQIGMYGKHPIQMEPASDIKRSGVCPFYERSGQHLEAETTACTVGAHFAEDNLPAFGKLVMLSDFARGCTDKERSEISGARFYLLGWGEEDRCGSVHYQKSLSFGVESVVGHPGRRTSQHTLEMFDHRTRRLSMQCPARESAIELHEKVETFEEPNDSSQKPIPLRQSVVRSFYSPKDLALGKGRSPSGSPK